MSHAEENSCDVIIDPALGELGGAALHWLSVQAACPIVAAFRGPLSVTCVPQDMRKATCPIALGRRGPPLSDE